MKNLFSLFFLLVLMASCSKEDSATSDTPDPTIAPVPSSIGIVGDSGDFKGNNTIPGIVLMGGSTDVDAAMQWMIARAGGGDFVIIRASGSTGYNQYLYDFGGLNSVETLLINSRTLAENEKVAEQIKNAEALFIAGGDQKKYVDYWKDTKLEEAINYLINEKGAPVGGTSAGCAILGEIVFDAKEGTIYTDEALQNPYDRRLSLLRSGFLQSDFLQGVVTDTHYSQRERQGRHVAFLARIAKDWQVLAKGIGVDEKTAVCINEQGMATVMGQNNAYFLMQANAGNIPENCKSGEPLTWNHDGTAVKTYVVKGNNAGNGAFNLKDWESANHTAGAYENYSVVNGVLIRKAL